MLTDKTQITFWIDEVCSNDIGIKVIGFPTFTGAEKRVTKYSIPGRNGDLTYWDGSFSNVSCEISCYIASKDRIADALSAVNNWLSGSGYLRFAISSEPGRYRMARVTNAADIGIRMGVLAPFTLLLDCKPQRFFDDESTVTIPVSGGTMYNATKFVAEPKMRCYRTAGGILAEEILVKSDSAEGVVRMTHTDGVRSANYIDIDFESKAAVNDAGENIPIEKFSTNGLSPGLNTIKSNLSASWFSNIEILPRWWTL